MTVQSSGRVMVRVSRAHFQAITTAMSTRAQPGRAGTRPLFAARYLLQQGAAEAGAAPTQEWLLHDANQPDMHPWDVAHLVAQGKLPGSEQFGLTQPAYAEPDLLNTSTRSPAARVPAAMLAEKSAQSTQAPWQANSPLNTNYAPPSNTVFSPAWHLAADFGNFISAWGYNKGAGIRIAHLDTGYTPSHMSTPRNMLPQQGYNFYENNTNTVDPYLSGLTDQPGHGTATLALLAGGSVDIEYGAGPIYNGDIGGAPDASIVPVRIGPSVIHFYSADVAQGLDYALAPSSGGMCDVVTLSHGGLPSNAWADAVNRLYDAGVVVVAASGDSIYLQVADVATHFTVYPSAFYRVITATGATYAKGPYITTNFGVMQGCWGPDKVMEKAVAAYTPNVPWMSSNTNPHAWDMDGGGTSASTPQIAAACALWLAQYGHQFPTGWQRVEACRHALFESVKNRGANPSEIGVGLLDAGAMLSPVTQQKVQQAYQQKQLPYAPLDQVSFPFFRLLFGLAPPGPGVDEMYETEAAQIFFRSSNKELASAVEQNPDGAPQIAPDAATMQRLREAFIAEPSISNSLKTYLQSKMPKSTSASTTAAVTRGGTRRFKLGWVPDLPDHRDFDYMPSKSTMAALPVAVDLRPNIPFAPYDQGQIGSCTANAIAAAIEFNRLKNRQDPDFVPSRLFIYYNERSMEQTIPMDSGAQLRDGIKSVAQLGVCPETVWPYDPTPPDPATKLFPNNSRAIAQPPPPVYSAASKYKAISYFSLDQSLSQLKGCLADGFPFVFGFTVYANMYDANGDPVVSLSLPGSSDELVGGHAVLAVGYRDDTQQFIIRNSWGTTVQDRGYYYMPYAYLLDANLANSFWTIRADAN